MFDVSKECPGCLRRTHINHLVVGPLDSGETACLDCYTRWRGWAGGSIQVDPDDARIRRMSTAFGRQIEPRPIDPEWSTRNEREVAIGQHPESALPLRAEDYSSEQARRFAKYGMKVRDMIDLFTAQRGRCLLCLEHISISQGTGVKQCVIDHCHETHQVRGLLCGYCNTMLGRIGDSIDWAYRAARYLSMAHDNAGWASRVIWHAREDYPSAPTPDDLNDPCRIDWDSRSHHPEEFYMFKWPDSDDWEPVPPDDVRVMVSRSVSAR